jgi:protein-tyrosine phosphatase
LIDLHSHVLPGIDDGPATMEGSLQILRAAREDGITKLAATPHVRDDWRTAPETMERLVIEVNVAARAAAIGVEVLPGGELDLEYLETLDDDELRRFGLGGNPGVLLLEFPYVGWPIALRDLLFRLELRGFRAVIAHPERNAEVQAAPERLRELVDAGALVQVTAASLDGRLGGRTVACAQLLVREQLAHLIASDAHAPSIRAVGMTAAQEAVGDEALARWLTDGVPRALVDGTPLPPRPKAAKPWLRLRRRH